MSRFIDANACERLMARRSVKNYKGALEALWDTPTADVAEVVRCLACKYYQKVYGGVPLGEVGHCICHSFETVPDWYCADGEKKEE